MMQWEHKVIVFDKSFVPNLKHYNCQAYLNHLGTYGWQVCGFSGKTVIMKRKTDKEADADPENTKR